MRLRDGRYECIVCGVVLDIATDKTPRVTITSSSGEDAMRTIRVDGLVVHSCPLRGPDKEPGTRHS